MFHKYLFTACNCYDNVFIVIYIYICVCVALRHIYYPIIDALIDCTGVGHSMGATAMLIAALKEPKRFRALVLYEPIIYPPYLVSPYEIGMKDAPLAIGARRRKYKFSSFADALENFSSKSMFQKFDSEVLRDYVRHGLMRYKDINVDELRKALDLKDYDWNLNESCNEEVCLRCSPDNEAFVYNSVSAHYIRDDLKNLTGVPTLVLSGNDLNYHYYCSHNQLILIFKRDIVDSVNSNSCFCTIRI